MNCSVYRNISFATVAGLADLLDHGAAIEVRGATVRELRSRMTVLSRPRERCLFVPYRMNDMIANLAETFWVLAGRNDVAWLTPYLPRAIEYSDDGVTWRGGYGPRLRDWKGVDQIGETRRLLLQERATRRAVMSLFDPDRDFVDSKDIPCNNWFHWLIRDSRLHLTASVRSNDLMWGFSGINSFCWSVLHEMMAFWVGADVGESTYLASSFHLYERHFESGQKAVKAFRGTTCYDFGLEGPLFQTPFEDFNKVLQIWFEMEADARQNPNGKCDVRQFLDDPFLQTSLQLVRLHHGSRAGWDSIKIAEALASMQPSDMTAAAYEFFARSHPEIVDLAADSKVIAFLEAYRGQGSKPLVRTRTAELLNFVKHVHAEKSTAYGDSWKKRGELTSILANIARKVDRLARYRATGAVLVDESVLDTAIDLFVYLLKYRLYLLERAPSVGGVLGSFSPPFSDDPACFDALAATYCEAEVESTSWESIVDRLIRDFEDAHALATSGAPVVVREARAAALAQLSFLLVQIFERDDPTAVWRWTQSLGN